VTIFLSSKRHIHSCSGEDICGSNLSTRIRPNRYRSYCERNWSRPKMPSKFCSYLKFCFSEWQAKLWQMRLPNHHSLFVSLEQTLLSTANLMTVLENFSTTLATIW